MDIQIGIRPDIKISIWVDIKIDIRPDIKIGTKLDIKISVRPDNKNQCPAGYQNQYPVGYLNLCPVVHNLPSHLESSGSFLTWMKIARSGQNLREVISCLHLAALYPHPSQTLYSVYALVFI